MSKRLTHPPEPIMRVHDIAIDALLGGSHGWLHIPPGGKIEVGWLQKGCYRLTVDLTAGHKLDDAAADFNNETRARLETFFAPDPRGVGDGG